MSFRTIVVNNRCKLEYSLNYLVCRGEKELRINVSEISTLIIQNVGVSMTAALLSKLMESKVKIIFCDPKSNPQGELIPYQGSHDSFSKIETQVKWKQETKASVWKRIIEEKIKNQTKNLEHFNKDGVALLASYSENVQEGDPSNREGHAAKVYFSSCFGQGFSRDSESPTNAYLNYGYSILLSSINREVNSFGYLTQLGIHHIGTTNPFNLSCDLVEPLRPLVDSKVLNGSLNLENFKENLVRILEERVSYESNEMFLDNAIHEYVQSFLIAMREDAPHTLKFINYELA